MVLASGDAACLPGDATSPREPRDAAPRDPGVGDGWGSDPEGFSAGVLRGFEDAGDAGAGAGGRTAGVTAGCCVAEVLI